MYLHPTDYFISIVFSSSIWTPIFWTIFAADKYFLYYDFLSYSQFSVAKSAPVSAHLYCFLRSICTCMNIYFSSANFSSNVLFPLRYVSSFGAFSTADLFASTLSYGTADCSFFRVLRYLTVSNCCILVTAFSFVLLIKIDAVSA